ncbi:MAG: hypothetical protein IKO61_01010 [Lachnospiraceae bacterium]|nr:hypothetical protein [Lachnospiraceae bacterium]
MEESLFKNTRMHEDNFKTGDISKEYHKTTREAEDVGHRFGNLIKGFETLDTKVKEKDDFQIIKMKKKTDVHLSHGVDYELERPKHKNHVGFSRLYTEIEEKDSKYMKLVRTTLGRYYDYKEILNDKNLTPDQFQWAIEAQMNALNEAIKACKNYASNRKVRIFKTGRKRRAEVKTLKEKAEKELESMKSEYADFMDNKVKKNGYAQANSIKDMIRLKVPKAAKGKKAGRTPLDLSMLDMTEVSDRESYSEKHHMAIRSELDLKRKDLTEEEKTLLKKIKEYSTIRTNAAYIEYLRKNNSSKKKAARKELQKEGKLLKEITASLDAMKDISEEKQKMFELYKNNLFKFRDGGLDLTKEKVDEYHTLDLSSKNVILCNNEEDDGEITKEKMYIKDRTDEPLFSHEPCMSDVVQAGMGNCFVLAAVAELVANDSRAIVNMMHDDGKTVTVRLYSRYGYGSSVTMVPYHVKIDKRVDENAASDTLWVQLLCKAMAAFLKDHHVVTDEVFNQQYKKVTDAMYQEYLDDKQYIEYGYISNGGFSNEITPILTGELYKKEEEILGTGYEVTSDVDVIKIMHESKYTDEKQKKLIESGKLFDLDVAYYEENKKSTGKPQQMVYIKSVYSEMESKLEKQLAKVHREYPSVTEKQKRIEADDKLKREYRSLPYILKYYANTLLDHASEISDHIIDYMNGDPSLTKEQNEKCKIVYDSIKKDPHAIFRNGDNAFPELMAKKPLELLEIIEEIATHLYKRNRYDSIISQMFRDEKGDKAIPDNPTEKDKKDEMIKMKKACMRLTSKCMSDIERVHFGGMDKVKEAGDDIEKKYSIIAGLVDSLTVKDAKSSTTDVENAFISLSQLLDMSLEDTLKQIKKVMKEKYRIYEANREEVSNGKTAQIFTGCYTGTTLKLYNRIKEAVRKGERLNLGSRSGFGKKTERGETQDKGTLGKHAYSVLGVQDVQFRGKTIHMVKVRNPWGGYTLEYLWNEKTKTMEYATSQADRSGVFFIELTHLSKVFHILFPSGEKKIGKE